MLLVLIPVVVEGSLHLLYAVVNRQPFPFRSYDETIQRVASLDESPTDNDRLAGGATRAGDGIIEVIHPYLGFVLDPERVPDTSYLGFPQENDDPFHGEGSDAVTVAIFGGSFAAGVSVQGESVMQSTLRKHGIDARILTVAMGGYKQPQQLFALAYLLSHDAQIDVVVNIDGFNEVALPPAENLPKGINPFYPRAWYSRTLRLNDQATLRRIGRISVLRDDRRRWATIFRGMPRFSIIRNVVWRSYDTRLKKQVTDLHDQIRRSKPLAAKRFLTTGPDLGTGEEKELYQQIADHWSSCSLLMKALGDSQGMTYVHILQPNQYFEAGKTLSEKERQHAFRENQPYRQGVVEGYPRLLAAKNGLIERGVDFHDLTMIFHDIPQTIYADDCCHLNKLGYEIIAEYIADTIARVTSSGAARRAP